MKIKKIVLTVLLLMLVLSANGMSVFAMNTGFDIKPVSEEEKESFVDAINFSILDKEYKNKSIHCFDVREDGTFAIGSEHNKMGAMKDIVSVYSAEGVFQYGYIFDSPGSFYLEWDGENVLIYFVRSNFIISVNPEGEVEEAADVPMTPANDSYSFKLLKKTECVVGDKTYEIKNDMGAFLNFISFTHSQLVVTDSDGNSTILYDVGTYQLIKTLFVITAIVAFFVCFIIFMRRNIKAYEKEKTSPKQNSVETNSERDTTKTIVKILLFSLATTIVPAVCCTLMCSACVRGLVSPEHSEANFYLLQSRIEDTAQEYGFSAIECSAEELEDYTYTMLTVEISEEEKITILLKNDSDSKTGYGKETFTIEYTNTNPSGGDFCRTDLLCDLANTIAYKEFDKSFLEEFFSADESEYPASDFGFQKLNGEKIAKRHYFDSFENEMIAYTLDAENCETVTIWGRVKQVTS
ncbi:MAG: hypothetical protein E7546_05870 [Ruminococcaceae bacterium]|nr:hypothetical protein [Oscillospiraceae bacterium]